MILQMRPYQLEVKCAVITDWETHQSTLVVLPTGCGKTIVFLDLARDFLEAHPTKKVLILAHREELIFQPVSHWKRMTGAPAAIEMGQFKADKLGFQFEMFDEAVDTRIIVATVQTLNSQQRCPDCNGVPCGQCNDGRRYRMQKWAPDEVGLVIIDEAHHSVAETYLRVLDYFKRNSDLKILGVTATPDRADEEAMGKVYQSVAYDYQLPQAIHDGWLVPIEQHYIVVEDLDFSSVRTTAGDLNEGDLEEIIRQERILHRIVNPTLEMAGDRPGLFFTPGIESAQRTTEIINRHRPGAAVCILGTTDRETRRYEIDQYQKGKRQFLVGCGVFLEGFDAPATAIVAMARPTKSRSLYAQSIGRGTRPLSGLVDAIESADGRRAAIAASEKPKLSVLDFVGNSGRHKLISTADILGDEYPDEIVERAIAKARKSGSPIIMQQALEEAEKEERDERRKREEQAASWDAHRRQEVKARVSYSSRIVDPFDLFDTTPKREPGWHKGRKPTPRMLEVLTKSFKVPIPPDCSFWQAQQLIETCIGRVKKGLCSYKQATLLQKHGYEDAPQYSMKQASETIDKLAKNGWKRPQ